MAAMAIYWLICFFSFLFCYADRWFTGNTTTADGFLRIHRKPAQLAHHRRIILSAQRGPDIINVLYRKCDDLYRIFLPIQFKIGMRLNKKYNTESDSAYRFSSYTAASIKSRFSNNGANVRI